MFRGMSTAELQSDLKSLQESAEELEAEGGFSAAAEMFDYLLDLQLELKARKRKGEA